MPIQIGQQLGSLEIATLLGKGGMGEVYRARDTKLKREVAVKILPDEFSRDRDRVARFQREAEVLASLNHPNIAGIYDLQHSGETQFLVMELVEGETLADRIKRGPLPVEEALQIGKSICEALEAAHEKGVVHRDLKPANVKITPDGKAKVLDFGLAKAFEAEKVASNLSNSPTLVSGSMPGLILGTAAYMSPEQAIGRSVDRRSDIFAFGCVLYEMLTGKAAFSGQSTTEIIASVLKEEPDWTSLPISTPSGVRSLLRRCLHKDVAHRLRDAADIRIELEEALASSIGVPKTKPAVVQSRSWLRMVPWVVAVVLSIITLAVWFLKSDPKPEVRNISRFTLTIPQQLSTGSVAPAVVLSPDGSHLVYVAAQGASQQLFLRNMDSLETKPLAGTDGAASPFFSPDGQWIGFFASGQLKKVPVNGGASLALCSACASNASVVGATWAPDDMIYFANNFGNSGISKVSAAGGMPQVFTSLSSQGGEIAHRWPEVLPGGKAILFTVHTSGDPDAAEIVVQPLVGTGQRNTVIRGGTFPHYAPSGRLLYYRAGTLMAVPFDPFKFEVKSGPVPVLESVMPTANVNGGAEFGISATGSLVYIAGAANASTNGSTFVWVDRKGTEQAVGAPPRRYSQPQLSPDGQQLAVRVLNQDIWVYDLVRKTLTRLTFEGANGRPVWSPDGKRISFLSAKPGGTNWFWKLADGSGPEEQLTRSQHFYNPASFTHDGKIGFYSETAGNSGYDIWTVELDGERKTKPFLQTPFNETVPVISPDDRWLAYISDESGRYEVYVRAFPGPGGKWQISTDGGNAPIWSHNGRELFFQNDDKIMAVDITTEPAAFRAGTPHVLFEGKYEWLIPIGRNWDVSPDGQRFLMIKSTGSLGSQSQITVVENWFEELKQRVPVH